jgi:cation diffusion facilitator family transporter
MKEDHMHTHSTSAWEHEHFFLGDRHDRHERRTMFVVALTAAMMVAEIIGGTAYGSMALVADGWHMSTHAAALGIAALAYRFARVHAHSPQFSFGTGKLGELAAFASAIILAMIALFIGYESVTRLYQPVTIRFSEALPIAALGLVVNLASAWLLHDDHDHVRSADHHDDHAGHARRDGHHHDSNIRAAYVHVMADALTSVLAIVALMAGRFYGVTWLDPVMGLIGTLVILGWSWSLVRSAGAVLLDAVPDARLSHHIREHLEIDGDRVSDLHIWRLGPGHIGLIASVVSDRPQTPDVYKQRVAHIPGLAHVTVEVHACGGHI